MNTGNSSSLFAAGCPSRDGWQSIGWNLASAQTLPARSAAALTHTSHSISKMKHLSYCPLLRAMKLTVLQQPGPDCNRTMPQVASPRLSGFVPFLLLSVPLSFTPCLTPCLHPSDRPGCTRSCLQHLPSMPSSCLSSSCRPTWGAWPAGSI